MKNKKTLLGIIVIVFQIFILLFFVVKADETDLFKMQYTNDYYELFENEEPKNQIITEQTDQGLKVTAVEQEYDKHVATTISTPKMTLKPGKYDVTIQYNTDTNGNRYKIDCFDNRYLDSEYLIERDGYLSSYDQEITVTVNTMKEVNDFVVKIEYMGVGNITVSNIVIAQVRYMDYRKIFVIVMILIMIDFILFFNNQIQRWFAKQNYKKIVVLLGIIVLSSIPLFVRGYYNGHDSGFHLLRIEGIKEAILSGQFPAKLSPIQFRGYGYASTVMYPDLFLYPAVILRLLGFDAIFSYKAMLLIINILTTLIAEYSFEKIFKNKYIGLLGCLLYVLAPYRIMDLYYRAAVGEVCAMIGFPLIAYGIFALLSRKDEIKSIYWVDLAIGFSIVVQSHILSSIFVGFFSIIIAILYIKYIFKKEIIIDLLKCIGLSVLLNLNFLVPFLDYYRLPLNTAWEPIQQQGIVPAQLFTRSVISEGAHFSKSISEGIDGEILLGIGYGILILVFIFILEIKNIVEYKRLAISSFILGSIAIVMSMYWFPYDKVDNESFLGKIIINIQFPWRFLELVPVFYILTSLVALRYFMKKDNRVIIAVIICIIAIFDYLPMTDFMLEKMNVSNSIYLNSDDLGACNEYLIQDTDWYSLKTGGATINISGDNISFSDYFRRGTNAEINVCNKGEDGYIELPIFMYPGYKVVNKKTNQQFDITYGTNNILRIIIPKHFEGFLEIKFDGKWYWKIASIVSIATVLVVLQILLKNKIVNLQKK